jgi:hypothetical protein
MKLFNAPSASEAQCARYLLARLKAGTYDRTDVTKYILPTYYRICQQVGLDPAYVVAQMIHETGHLSSWWSQRPRRNPAGFGVTGHKVDATGPYEHDMPRGSWAKGPDGRWWEGVSFQDWEHHAIPAHIGRVLAYALTDAEATNQQKLLIERALKLRNLPPSYRGRVNVWTDFNGLWAVPGRTYGQRIAVYVRRMMEV